MQVRPAKSEDLEPCGALDHSYTTDHVWQMETSEENGARTIVFRLVRLPREIQVDYPRQGDELLVGWRQRDAFLVAEEKSSICGYATLNARPEQGFVWVSDLVVDRPLRRRGIGTSLLRAAARWGHKRSLNRLTLELQTKNYPAIQFSQSLGLKFSGYNDHYWPTQDIAVFFSRMLR